MSRRHVSNDLHNEFMPGTTDILQTAIPWLDVHGLIMEDVEDLHETESPLASQELVSAHASTGCEASIQSIEEYLLVHCQIKTVDLKPNALSRLRDLHCLFAELKARGTIRLARSHGSMNSVFGFSRIFVDEVCTFNDEVVRMVEVDERYCWKVNGKRTLQQPTSPVYEVLRQCGIHPVKGTRILSSKNNAPSLSRNFMMFGEYVFDAQRMKRNCSRLKIGVIGNRRV